MTERLAQVNDTLRRSAHREAAEVAREIKLESLSEARRVELDAALASLCAAAG